MVVRGPTASFLVFFIYPSYVEVRARVLVRALYVERERV
jgi:hypothetical protein